MEQLELALDSEATYKGVLLATLDRINDRFVRGTIGLASAGMSRSDSRLSMRPQLRAHEYTTSMDNLPVARA